MPTSFGSSPQPPLAPSVPGAQKPEQSNVAAQKSTRISHACQMCKIRKTKCDGKTPCWRCQMRQTDCNYDSSDRRRARSLLLKDFNAIRDNVKSYEKLMELFRTSDEEGAQHALGLIRSRSFPSIQELVQEIEDCTIGSPESQCASLDAAMTDSGSEILTTENAPKQPQPSSTNSATDRNTRSPSSGNSSSASPSSRPLNNALQSNMRTELTSPITATSEEILFGSNVSSPHHSIADPTFSMYSFRPHPTLSKVPGTNGMDVLQVSFKTICVTPFRNFNIWPKSWTSVITDDTIASHLISLSSAWLQCMHNFLDLDSFIQDVAVEKTETSRFCSPLLFNSMMAIGCLFCVHEEAFVDTLEPMSRGEHFIAEAKKLLSQHHPTASLSMENLTHLQSLPLIALFEASRMRTAAAWYYTTWFFNVCLELGLPEVPNGDYSPEKRRLGQMAVSYALFLTERLWFTYTSYVEKLLLSGSAPFSVANMFPASSIASRRATIGPCSVTAKLFSSEPTPPTDPSFLSGPSSLGHRRNSHQSHRPSILRVDTEMHENADGQGCKFELSDLIQKLRALITAAWDDGGMAELLILHGKLQVWMTASSGNMTPAGGEERDWSAVCDDAGMNVSSVDPGMLNLRPMPQA